MAEQVDALDLGSSEINLMRVRVPPLAPILERKMQVKINKKEGSQLTFEVEVPKETVSKVFFEAFNKVSKQVQIPGFRKGKAPRKMFEQKYGKESIEQEAIKQLYPLIYNKIIKEEKITPLTYPRIEVVKFSDNEPAIIKMEIATKPDIKLGTYKDIKIKSNKIKIEKEEVNEQLKKIQKTHAEYLPLIENRPTQEGDWLALEMHPLSTKLNSPKEKRENLWYQLGSDQLPPSFHKELMGVKLGEEKPVESTIPPNHPRKELAGKKISLNVKVKDIRKEKLPELNDEFAKKLNFENVKTLKERIKKELKNFKEKREKEKVKTEIVEKVLKNSKVDVPPLLIEEGIEEKTKRLKEELKKEKLNISSYLKEKNMTEEKLKKLFKNQVEFELKTLLVLDKIAQEEKIEVREEEIEERIQLLTQGMGEKVNAKQLKEELTRKGRLSGLIQRIKNEKIIDFLYNQAEISQGVLSSLK